MPAYAIGIDVGGTFTDCFVTDGARGWRGKAPTTPPALADGLMAALETAAADVGRPLAELLAATTHFAFGVPAKLQIGDRNGKVETLIDAVAGPAAGAEKN